MTNLNESADDVAPLESTEERDLDVLCESWVSWTRSRRLYGPRPSLGGTLGRLSGTSTRPLRRGPPDAISSAELSAFHIAYTCQPDALDRRVFEAYYVLRIKPIKRAAEALGISRTHFYDVLASFRRRVDVAARNLMITEAEKLNEITSHQQRESR
ncbi:hypothetical protein BH10PSE18_BH10PSE18_15160 [soil metagenome]